ncbi:MAG: hypothetical protein RMH74_02655 [Candidatus Caldarchaeum sp.]|nr:hypothetical protein [Candidatus Caldarchaeum sp.]
MALELYRAVDCLDYVGDEPRLPAITVVVEKSVKGHKASLTIPVDTGFAGYILVDQNT